MTNHPSPTKDSYFSCPYQSSSAGDGKHLATPFQSGLPGTRDAYRGGKKVDSRFRGNDNLNYLGGMTGNPKGIPFAKTYRECYFKSCGKLEGNTLEHLRMDPQRIRELRQRMQMTQEDFAHMIGVTFSTVNRWENGKSQPNRIAIRLLSGLEKKAKAT
jgi:DNA-binding transcriptional regulator YiaG